MPTCVCVCTDDLDSETSETSQARGGLVLLFLLWLQRLSPFKLSFQHDCWSWSSKLPLLFQSQKHTSIVNGLRPVGLTLWAINSFGRQINHTVPEGVNPCPVSVQWTMRWPPGSTLVKPTEKLTSFGDPLPNCNCRITTWLLSQPQTLHLYTTVSPPKITSSSSNTLTTPPWASWGWGDESDYWKTACNRHIQPSRLKRRSQADDWWLWHISAMRSWRLWGDWKAAADSFKLASEFRGRGLKKMDLSWNKSSHRIQGNTCSWRTKWRKVKSIFSIIS